MKLDKLRRIQLKNLLINRIDLVDEGDNPEARIVFWKRAPDLEEKKKTQLLTELEITEISLVDKGASPSAQVTLWKRDVSKAVHGPSDILGLRLLGVLSSRVDNLKLEQSLTRMEAWLSVLQSPEGKELLGFIGKAKTEPTSFFEGVEQQDVEELADFLEGPDGGPFLKSFSKALKQIRKEKHSDMDDTKDVIRKIIKKEFKDTVTAMAGLRKAVIAEIRKGGHKATPEQLVAKALIDNPEANEALEELPWQLEEVVKSEKSYGPTWDKISKMADELLAEGKVSSKAKGVAEIIDRNPTLLPQYLKDQL